MSADLNAEYVRVAEAALRAHGPEIGAEMWYSHRDAAEVVVRALAEANLVKECGCEMNFHEGGCPIVVDEEA